MSCQRLALFSTLFAAGVRVLANGGGEGPSNIVTPTPPLPTDGVATESLPCMADCTFIAIYPLPCDAIYGCLSTSCTNQDLEGLVAFNYGGSFCPLNPTSAVSGVSPLVTSSTAGDDVSSTVESEPLTTSVNGTQSAGSNTPADGSSLPQDGGFGSDPPTDADGVERLYAGMKSYLAAITALVIGVVVF